jgi:hypothetical protein
MDEIIDRLAGILSPWGWYRAAARWHRELVDWCDIRVTSPLAVLAGLNCVGGMILIRAQGGGMTFRLTDARLCAAAGAAAGLAIASRWALSNCQREEPAFWIKSLLAAFSVLPLAALFSVARPHNSLLALSVVAALAVVAGNANLLWKRKSQSMAAERGTPGGFRPEVASAGRHSEAAPIAAVQGSLLSNLNGLHERPRLIEWCERSTDEFGNAVVRGNAVARFEPGQSLATVHIPFQPPFERAPAFSFEAIDAATVRMRTPAVFRYGVRLEVKRSGEIDAPLQTPVRFQAVAHEPSARAA